MGAIRNLCPSDLSGGAGIVRKIAGWG